MDILCFERALLGANLSQPFGVHFRMNIHALHVETYLFHPVSFLFGGNRVIFYIYMNLSSFIC